MLFKDFMRRFNIPYFIMKTNIIITVILLNLFGCGGKNTESNVTSPGEDKTGKSQILETGAEILQDKTPINQIAMYLDGFHFYNGNMGGQMEAHHYCTQINEDLTQCIIYDGNEKDAKIMGVEYIVSERMFRKLPEEEKKLWHSHHYEVKSGTLIAPGLPDNVENKLMEELVATYGKTFHTWHTDHDLELPMGVPQIMMGFTENGQLNDSLVQVRDQRFEISTAEKKENRSNIPMPEVVEGANAWEEGEIRQLKISNEAPDIKSHNH